MLLRLAAAFCGAGAVLALQRLRRSLVGRLLGRGTLPGRPEGAGGFEGSGSAEGTRVQLGQRGAYVHLTRGRTYYTWLQGEASVPARRLVVLVHGAAGESSIFVSPDRSRYAEALLKAGFDVLCFDLYGHGFSEGPDVNQYCAELWASQLAELLMSLGITCPFDLFGHSLGGPIVAVFAARFPQRVRRLVLQAPAMAMPPPVLRIAKALSALPLLAALFAKWWVPHRMGEGANVDNRSACRTMYWLLAGTGADGSNGGTFFLNDKRQSAVELLCSLPGEVGVYILVGDADELVSVESMVSVLNGLGGRDKALCVVPSASHVPFDGPSGRKFGEQFREHLLAILQPAR